MRVMQCVAMTAMGLLLVLGFGMVISQYENENVFEWMQALPAKHVASLNIPSILQFTGPFSAPGTGPALEPVGPGSAPNTLHVSGGADASTEIQTTAAPSFHDASTSQVHNLMHVSTGPDRTRLVYDYFLHATIQGPDHSRYFDPSWVHNALPGPMFTVYVGSGWQHYAFSTVLVPPGLFHASEPGPDYTKMFPYGSDHIYNSTNGHNTEYVPPSGPGSGVHIWAGPDETTWVPSVPQTFHDANWNVDYNYWAPPGWDHIESGADATALVPPGWEHKGLGPNSTIYLPADYFHANKKTSGRRSNADTTLSGELPGQYTLYLPPGWLHASNERSSDFTDYFPPGSAHATESGGTWPHPSTGLGSGGRTRFIFSDYIPGNWHHVSDRSSKDYTLYVPGTGATHIHGGPDTTHLIPVDWWHTPTVVETTGGMQAEPTSYLQPGWKHIKNGEDESKYAWQP